MTHFWRVRMFRQAEDGGGGEADPPPAPQAPEPPPPPPPAADWRDRRIAQLTARLREAETKPAPAPVAPAPVPTVVVDEAEVDRRATAKAQGMLAQQTFQSQLDTVAAAAKKTMPDFDVKVLNLVKVVDQTDQNSINAYNAMLLLALESDDAARVWYELGSDQNLAQEVLSLPPAKMAARIIKMAAAPKKRARGENGQFATQGDDGEDVEFETQQGGDEDDSNAPEPIPQVVGSRTQGHKAKVSAADPRSDKMLDDASWMAQRNREIEARRPQRR